MIQWHSYSSWSTTVAVSGSMARMMPSLKRIRSLLRAAPSGSSYIPIPLREQGNAHLTDAVGGEDESEEVTDAVTRASLERSLVKKLDRSLMPVLLCMIILKYISRGIQNLAMS